MCLNAMFTLAEKMRNLKYMHFPDIGDLSKVMEILNNWITLIKVIKMPSIG